MHPFERLRHVARAGGVDHGVLAEEVARALTGFVDDPSGLVTACRRMLDRHPSSGPMWWLAAHVLATNDPRAEAFRCVSRLQDDKTPAALAYELPDDATVVVLGWPEQVSDALARRGDIRSLVIDVLGEGSGLVGRLIRADAVADEVDPSHLAGAVRAADLVLVEATAVGPDAFVGIAGSAAAVALARDSGTEVWLVAGEGRVLPERLWTALLERFEVTDPDRPAWMADEEVVDLAGVDFAVGPKAKESLDAMHRRADAPVVPELYRSAR